MKRLYGHLRKMPNRAPEYGNMPVRGVFQGRRTPVLITKRRFALSCSYKKEIYSSSVKTVTGLYAPSGTAADSGATCVPNAQHCRTKGKEAREVKVCGGRRETSRGLRCWRQRKPRSCPRCNRGGRLFPFPLQPPRPTRPSRPPPPHRPRSRPGTTRGHRRGGRGLCAARGPPTPLPAARPSHSREAAEAGAPSLPLPLPCPLPT